MKYTLRARIDGGDGGEEEWELERLPTEEELEERLRSWFLEGDWDGFEGTEHSVDYEIYEGEELLDEGTFHFRVPWNEEKLIQQTLEKMWRSSDPDVVFLRGVVEDCEHEWERTAGIEGGCDTNPGVWAGPGDTIIFREHCAKCGLQRRRVLEGGETVGLEYSYDPKVAKKIWGAVRALLERELFDGAVEERILLEEYLRKYPWHEDRIQEFFAENATDPEVADLLDSPHRERLLARLLHET
jgi:hypothetical protein